MLPASIPAPQSLLRRAAPQLLCGLDEIGDTNPPGNACSVLAGILLALKAFVKTMRAQ